jgi:hypothetical protein
MIGMSWGMAHLRRADEADADGRSQNLAILENSRYLRWDQGIGIRDGWRWKFGAYAHEESTQTLP